MRGCFIGMNKLDKKPRIAYGTWTDPRDKRSWSGTHYFILKALSEVGSVEIMGPLSNNRLIVLKKTIKLFGKLFRKNIRVIHTTLVAKEYARQLQEKLNGKQFDYMFAPAGSELIAYLKTNIPIIYLSDATFISMVDYYPGFINLLKISKKMGDEIERRAINKSSHIIYSSDWAANSAINYYHCDRDKISVIPFGANLEGDQSREDILNIRRNPIKTVNLLWIGVDWDRKGARYHD